jgi:hypothetical protein
MVKETPQCFGKPRKVRQPVRLCGQACCHGGQLELNSAWDILEAKVEKTLESYLILRMQKLWHLYT